MIITVVSWAAPFLVLGTCCAYVVSVLPGHRAACWCRAVTVHALIGWTLACIAAVYVWRTVRHPALYARYLAVRVFRRVGRCYPDGEPLDRDDMRAYIGLVRAWRQPAAPERTRT